jgi:hypothetical protein
MARDRDQHKGGHKGVHKDRRRLHTSKVREREEREEIRKVKFMAQPEKQYTPPTWSLHEQVQKLERELDTAAGEVDLLKAAILAKEPAKVDWPARLLAMFATLLAAALVAHGLFPLAL